jgi:mannose-6-phosphate isomerase-like protein (cupin superfamily)
MKRRLFLQLAAAATAFGLEAKADEAMRANKGFKVEARKDRHDEELLIMGGRFDCKVSARDTGGDLCVYHTFREQKGGPALHLHHQQDEWFFAMRGDFIFQVGDDAFHLHPGDSAFGPRQVPHTFAKVGDGEGEMLILFQPAGTIEAFFKEMSKAGPGIPGNQERDLKDLWERHGMHVVGPPLKVS